MSGKARAKAVVGGILAGAVIFGAGAALLAGKYFGLFRSLEGDEPSVPEGFFDVNATHAFVEFIDVGQGDAALIGSEGRYMLIDTGAPDDSNSLIDTLLGEGVNALDYLVLSVPNDEHIGEAAEIISRFEIGCVIVPDLPDELVPDSAAYNAFLETAEYMGTDVRTAKDERFALADCLFDIYVPSKNYNDLCDHSLFVRFVHGDNSFLFTGDSGKAEEEELVGRGAVLSADVYKAGNHGGRDSCCPSLLSAVRPKYTVISCGREDGYGNLNRDTLRRLNKFSGDVLLTAGCGNIRFESDGSHMRLTLSSVTADDASGTGSDPSSENDTSDIEESSDEEI